MFHLHPPKTGGTSIIRALMDHTDFSEKYQHLYPEEEIQQHILPNFHYSESIQNSLGDFVTLGIRNPYERILSWCNFLGKSDLIRKRDPMNVNKYISIFNRISKTTKNELQEIKNNYGNPIDLYRFKNELVMIYQCSDWEDSVDCEVKIIRFENLVEDFNKIYPNIELPKLRSKEWKKINNLSTWANEQIPDQNTLDKLNKILEADFERYNYTMYTHIKELKENLPIFQNND